MSSNIVEGKQMAGERLFGDKLTNAKGFEKSLPNKETRQAVIIGINKYPGLGESLALHGAERDAIELHNILIDPHMGHFDIPKDHFLVGENATCAKIREAVSDLFWNDNSCDLTLFYFSGHGFRDGRGFGYLAPCDMKKDKPFVCGINMEELKSLMLNSINKSSVIMIFDCCYSGIITQGDKTTMDGVEEPFEHYFKHLDKMKGGEGKFVLASSGPDEKSREITIPHKFPQENEEELHTHGIFTYYLLEGFYNKACSSQDGIITLGKIHEYAAKKLIESGAQEPRIYMADANNFNNIVISLSKNIYNENIQNILNDALKNYEEDDPHLLIVAAEQVKSLLAYEENEQAIDLKLKIDIKFKEFDGYVIEFFISRGTELKLEMQGRRVMPELQRLAKKISYDGVINLTNRDKEILAYLCSVSRGDANKYDIDMETFMKICSSWNNNPSSGMRPTSQGSTHK